MTLHDLETYLFLRSFFGASFLRIVRLFLINIDLKHFLGAGRDLKRVIGSEIQKDLQEP